MLIDTGATVVHLVSETACKTGRKSGWRRAVRAFVLLCALLLVCFLALEIQTSWLQARLFHSWAQRLSYSVEPGPAPGFRHPHSGPYDVRLGHSLLTGFLNRLEERGFEIASQARQSPEMKRLLDWGLSPAYGEKTQAGLRIHDWRGEILYAVSFPERAYPDFESIPDVIVRTVLFIENREGLEERFPYKNPALEWDRLGKAGLDLGLRRLGIPREVSGGSTLATQLVKMRHSPGGATGSPAEKLRQIASASLGAYSGGIATSSSRRRIITDYLNSIPLAAVPGYGEVQGLGDGLWAWFGADFGHVNRVLRYVEEPVEGSLDEQALAYRQALSLLLAIRKPTAYLVRDRAALDQRVAAYLDLLASAGIIPEQLRQRALGMRPTFRVRVETATDRAFAERKAADSVRVELLQSLGLAHAYDLDRLDLSAKTTLDGEAQYRIQQFLTRLNDPDFAGRAGLRQNRLLAEGDPERVIYSVALYERGEGANLLRVQADNLDQPLNINEQTKLELGSTAKLRTLVTYLEIITELHDRLGGLAPEELAALDAAPEDRLTRWAAGFLAAQPGATLETTLEAALERPYSASPHEGFFTGGGMHRFSNFTSADNGRVLSVRQAFRNSVNLVFIRLMRDIVQYEMYRLPGVTSDLLSNPADPRRRAFLERFAQREGRQLLTRFYQKHRTLKTDESLSLLAQQMRWKSPAKLAVLYRSVRPQDGVDGLAAYLIGSLLDPDLKQKVIEKAYEDYGPGKFDLADRAYISGVHPLELWLVEYLAGSPRASLGEIFRASEPYCIQAYKWLFANRNRRAQDRAIRVMLEVDTFRSIHRRWQRFGYPFDWLVPSLATALGSSGDTPAALAELAGIIANDGVRYPSARIEELHFARESPYETNLVRRPGRPARLIPAEAARLLRRELAGVVEQGTAIRARGALKRADGTLMPVGGKTGTGDNRYQMYGPDRRLLESRVMNRTATFVFLAGDRYFGTITAFVPGEQAAGYGFTSSLPVQIFKELTPVLSALAEGRPAPDLTAVVESRRVSAPPVLAPAANTPPAAASPGVDVAG